METYRIEDLSFAYPNCETPALYNVNLHIGQGDFVVLCGPSGCGKTTLLRQLKPGLWSHGTRNGVIQFAGMPIADLSARDAAAQIGFVQQSPENQIVTDKVWHELAFGLESLGLPGAEIRLRTAEMASFFGIQAWFHKPVTELSGGQKQILALASVMAMQPRVLILDEPTAQLDPIAAGEFLAMLGKINRELGITVILTEHRLGAVFPYANRVAVMDAGKILADGTPQEIALALREQKHDMLCAMPTPMRVWAACDGAGNCPITVREGAAWLRRHQLTADHGQLAVDVPPLAGGLKLAVALDKVWFRYGKSLPDVAKGLSFRAGFGEITAVLGGNGTGKTTMLSLIAGLYTPYRGKVLAEDMVYLLPQNPQALFTGKTVREDLLEVAPTQDRLAEMVKLCRLDGLLDRHPYDLSGGEQQRAALAKVLLLEPKILLLDEPTKGLDADYKQTFAAILQNLAAQGVAVILVSHDIDFCAEYAGRCALFFDGGIVTENPPRKFFSGNSFYTTTANRMARDVLPEAITATDIIRALGGTVPPPSSNPSPKAAPKLSTVNSQPPTVKFKFSKRTMIAALFILLTIPLTIYIGIHFFGDRRVHFTSLLILLQTMLPFAFVFESRKPQARELVIIAVLCALAVSGRAAFFMLPQFKPVLALVIIAGVAFGGESGFLVGAMTGFVSNLFFGQGPWTPWQMFAFGIIGFLAGILFRKGLLRRTPLMLAVFGGLAAFFIYGGILNPAGVLMFQPSPTTEMFWLAYLRGIPFDLIHAAATVLFLLLLAKPMLEKLDRIKLKYGLME